MKYYFVFLEGKKSEVIEKEITFFPYIWGETECLVVFLVFNHSKF